MLSGTENYKGAPGARTVLQARPIGRIVVSMTSEDSAAAEQLAHGCLLPVECQSEACPDTDAVGGGKENVVFRGEGFGASEEGYS